VIADRATATMLPISGVSSGDERLAAVLAGASQKGHSRLEFGGSTRFARASIGA
jgi:hypothetical protein